MFIKEHNLSCSHSADQDSSLVGARKVGVLHHKEYGYKYFDQGIFY
jgi:hypothetical protein